jgi:hypothetical protein
LKTAANNGLDAADKASSAAEVADSLAKSTDASADKSLAKMKAEIDDADAKKQNTDKEISDALAAESTTIDANSQLISEKLSEELKRAQDAQTKADEQKKHEEYLAEQERIRALNEKNAKEAAAKYIEYSNSQLVAANSEMDRLNKLSIAAMNEISSATSTKSSLESENLKLLAEKKTLEISLIDANKILAQANKNQAETAQVISSVNDQILNQNTLLAKAKSSEKDIIASIEGLKEEQTLLQPSITSYLDIVNNPDSSLQQKADALKLLIDLNDKMNQIKEKIQQQQVELETAKINQKSIQEQLSLLNKELMAAKLAESQAKLTADAAMASVSRFNNAISAVNAALTTNLSAQTQADSVIQAAKEAITALYDDKKALGDEIAAINNLIDAAKSMTTGDFNNKAEVDSKAQAALDANNAILAARAEQQQKDAKVVLTQSSLSQAVSSLSALNSVYAGQMSTVNEAKLPTAASLAQANAANNQLSTNVINMANTNKESTDQRTQTEQSLQNRLAGELIRHDNAVNDMITAKANDTANASIAQDTADKARKEEEKRQYDKLVDDLNKQIADALKHVAAITEQKLNKHEPLLQQQSLKKQAEKTIEALTERADLIKNVVNAAQEAANTAQTSI